MATSIIKKNPIVANNLTTTDEGYVLDARQGKVLSDQIANYTDYSEATVTMGSGVTKNPYFHLYVRGNIAVCTMDINVGSNNLASWSTIATTDVDASAVTSVMSTGLWNVTDNSPEGNMIRMESQNGKLVIRNGSTLTKAKRYICGPLICFFQ